MNPKSPAMARVAEVSTTVRAASRIPAPSSAPAATGASRSSACSARSSSQATWPGRRWRITSSTAAAAPSRADAARASSSSPRSGWGSRSVSKEAGPGGAEGLGGPTEDGDGVVGVAHQGLQPGFGEQVVGDAQAAGRGTPSPAEALRQQPLGLPEEPVGGVAAGLERGGEARVDDPGKAIEGRTTSAARSRWPRAWVAELLEVVGLVDHQGAVVPEQAPLGGLVAQEQGVVGHHQLGGGGQPARRDHVAGAAAPVGAGAAPGSRPRSTPPPARGPARWRPGAAPPDRRYG